MPGQDDTPTLSALLERHRDALARFLQKEARGLLRYEAVDDLVQGVHLQSIQVEEHFEYRGDDAFLGWLFTVARQHIARRHAHWTAMKRNAGHLIRVSTGSSDASSMGSSGVDPAMSATGPLTFAERREQLQTAVRALACLPERDRQLVQWMSEGVDIRDVADRLEIGYDAAQRARHRAIERFRQAFTVLVEQSDRSTS